MFYDAIVVGAGPAGSIAALNLAKAGCKTLLLEKEALGRNKSCAGGLTPRSYVNLEAPIDDLVLAEVDTVEVRLGGKIISSSRKPAATVRMVHRSAFDRRLAQTAANAGAEIHEKEAVVSVSADETGVEVESARGTFRARVLLLATGADYRLPASLGFSGQNGMRAVAINIEGRARYRDWDRMVLDFGIEGGYQWIFPKADAVSVGLAVMAGRDDRDLKSPLEEFISGNGIEFETRTVSGSRLCIWEGWRNLAKGRVALLGDAAQLIEPALGEGISFAMESGRLAARAAVDFLEAREPGLESYDARLRERLGPRLNTMRRLSRLVYSAPSLSLRLLTRFPPTNAWLADLMAAPFG